MNAPPAIRNIHPPTALPLPASGLNNILYPVLPIMTHTIKHEKIWPSGSSPFCNPDDSCNIGVQEKTKTCMEPSNKDCMVPSRMICGLPVIALAPSAKPFASKQC